MDPQYQSLHQQIERLKYEVQDAIKPDAGTGNVLRQQVQALQDALQGGHNARDLEQQVKNIMAMLHMARGDEGAVMDYGHAEHFYRVFEDMQMAIRRLPGY
jgi:hypothetical protein